MPKIKFSHIPILLYLFCILPMIQACTDEEIPFDIVEVEERPEILISKDWKVSYYASDDSDETVLFSGYVFAFRDNGALLIKAINGNQFIGSWSINEDNSLDKLNIAITGNDDLEELSDDWVILNFKQSKIELSESEKRGVEELTFTAID